MRLLDRIEVGFDTADAAVAVVIDERDETTVVEVECQDTNYHTHTAVLPS